MKNEVLDRAVELGTRLGQAFIATADTDKRPHLSVARSISLKGDNLITVKEWFCPGTMTNLQKNPYISVIVWDAKTDEGYQMLGNMEDMTDIGLLDGYDAKMKEKYPLPQIESQIIIRVNKITDFKRAPHSDIED